MSQSNPFARRDLLWKPIQKILGGFSSHQFKQFLLLSHNLGMAYADDGLPAHILTRAKDYPLLDQHLWLLDDWGIKERQSFDQLVFNASVFVFFAEETNASIADPHSFSTASYQPLADEFTRQALAHWKQAFSETHLFWNYYKNLQKTEFTAKSAKFAKEILNLGEHSKSKELNQTHNLSLIAAALFCNKEELIPQLTFISNELHGVLQTIHDLANFRRDVQNGLVTPTIQRALANIKGDSSNLSAEVVLGALIFTGSLEKTLKENEARIASARAVAVALNLPTFQAWCERLADLMLQVRELFSIQNTGQKPQGKLSRLFFAPAHDILQNVILKAESYLLKDPLFKESWEIQHNIYAFKTALIGQPFPSNLVIEILCLHGHDMSASIEETMHALHASGYQYYDDPTLLAPDTDNLALALRVIPYAKDPAPYRASFETPLRWMRENQLPSGQIPVWLQRNDSPYKKSDLAVLYGSNCATVETNLLLGLIVYDFKNYQDIIETCGRSWCERWLAIGLAASEHYPPLYSFWAGMELITQLEKLPVSDFLKTQLRMVAAYFRERLETEARRDDLTPQDASFLILASLHAQALPFNPNWITTLFKHQRHDGCWEGEPIYITPSARGLTTIWFKSRTITTAFCYHALKTYETADRKPQTAEGS